MTDSATRFCASCGSVASGNFCSGCGGSLGPRACAHCRAELSPQASFCHRCGHPVGGARSERKAWIIAGTLCAVLVAGIVYKVSSADSGPVAPDMANAGASTGVPVSGRAPDISTMTPRERFDRLYDRVMRAAGTGDSVEVQRFTPMALGAYQQLDTRDIDARYHAAMLHTQGEQWPAALALADTILAESPAHLFGYVIRGEVGRVRKDSALFIRAQRDFLTGYESAIRSNRVEYLEHKPALDEFKAEAEKRER